MKKCVKCRDDFVGSGKKFCSRSCSVSFNNSINSKKKKEGLCKLCGCQISKKRLYCSKCIKEYYKSIKSKNCSICGVELENSNKNHGWCKDCKSKKQKEHRLHIKQRCVDYKGGECQICGYNKCLAALEFHHIESHDKDFTISFASSSLKNMEEIKKELDKCILLCANCHRESHHSA